jgi:hypothetical protein
VKKRFYEKPPPGVNIKIKFFSRMRGHPAAAARAVLAEEVCPRCFLGFSGESRLRKIAPGCQHEKFKFFCVAPGIFRPAQSHLLSFFFRVS